VAVCCLDWIYVQYRDHVLRTRVNAHTRFSYQPMSSETAEIVETSDSEERNSLEASSQSYWQRFCPENNDVHFGTLSPDAPGPSWTKDDNLDDDSEAPHKRIKVC
jgi:hypothetical protein